MAGFHSIELDIETCISHMTHFLMMTEHVLDSKIEKGPSALVHQNLFPIGFCSREHLMSKCCTEDVIISHKNKVGETVFWLF